jgi:WD40 repeat protein
MTRSLTLCVTLLALGTLVQACRPDTELNGPAAPRVVGDAATEAGPQWSDWSTPLDLGPLINSESDDWAPAISRDRLSLYFASDRPGGLGGLDLYVTHRASVDEPWGAAQNLGQPANTGSTDFAPNLSLDGHSMYFTSDRPGGCGTGDLWVSHRRDAHDDFGWGPPVNLGCTLNSAIGEGDPMYFEDEVTGIATLYFASFNRPGGLGDFDIFASTRNGDDGAFGSGVLVPELSSPFRDTRTAIRRDGLEIILTSNRPGGFGGVDLWVSTRGTTLDPWSSPVNLGPAVNTPSLDGTPALSFDGTTLYFYSNRPDGVGGRDLYVATRHRLPVVVAEFAGSKQ